MIKHLTSLPHFLKLIIAIVISLSAGVIGSIAAESGTFAWYDTLIKPSLNPPSWVFAPVWTTLYVLMGIALFLIWKKGVEQPNVKIALGVFMVQLLLNTFWSIIFFGFQLPSVAFFEIIALWIAILATMITFVKISKVTLWLLAPYILWVSFAGYLNYMIWVLN